MAEPVAEPVVEPLKRTTFMDDPAQFFNFQDRLQVPCALAVYRCCASLLPLCCLSPNLADLYSCANLFLLVLLLMVLHSPWPQLLMSRRSSGGTRNSTNYGNKKVFMSVSLSGYSCSLILSSSLCIMTIVCQSQLPSQFLVPSSQFLYIAFSWSPSARGSPCSSVVHEVAECCLLNSFFLSMQVLQKMKLCWLP